MKLDGSAKLNDHRVINKYDSKIWLIIYDVTWKNFIQVDLNY